jgi:hypothetical protein
MKVSGQLHALAALPPGKTPQYQLDRRIGEAGLEKSLAAAWNQTQITRSSSP